MNIHYSERSAQVRPGIFSELARRKAVIEAEGINVYDLSIEMPDMSPSLDVREAVSGSASKAWNYSYSLEDMPQLRTAVCSWYNARYGVLLDPESEILCTSGRSDAVSALLNVLTDPGDTVLIQDPCDPYTSQCVIASGCKPVFMPLKEENDFLIDFSAISPIDSEKARVIIVSYPNNPTTATAPDSFYEELIRFASEHGIVVIHDNSYSDISYDGITGKSFLSFDGAKDVGIEINSLSSSYLAYGMKASFVLGNSGIVGAVSDLKSSTGTGLFYPVQYGIIAALTSDQAGVEETISLFEYRRDTLVEALADTPLKVMPCHGTPFLWVRLPDSAGDDMAFAYSLLERAHVLVTPGSAFGNEGRGFIRMAFNRRRPFLVEAADAIKRSMGQRDAHFVPS